MCCTGEWADKNIRALGCLLISTSCLLCGPAGRVLQRPGSPSHLHFLHPSGRPALGHWHRPLSSAGGLAGCVDRGVAPQSWPPEAEGGHSRRRPCVHSTQPGPPKTPVTQMSFISCSPVRKWRCLPPPYSLAQPSLRGCPERGAVVILSQALSDLVGTAPADCLAPVFLPLLTWLYQGLWWDSAPRGKGSRLHCCRKPAVSPSELAPGSPTVCPKPFLTCSFFFFLKMFSGGG